MKELNSGKGAMPYGKSGKPVGGPGKATVSTKKKPPQKL